MVPASRSAPGATGRPQHLRQREALTRALDDPLHRLRPHPLRSPRAPRQVATPHITVEALAASFWTKFLTGGAYGGPDAAAEALLGAPPLLWPAPGSSHPQPCRAAACLQQRAASTQIVSQLPGLPQPHAGILGRVYAQGGRDDVRAFLRGIKDQLAHPATRAAAGPPIFAVAASLAVAAERLRQVSTVKGHAKLGSVVLQELRLRLYRVVTGEAFASDTATRRLALDVVFVAKVRGLFAPARNALVQCKQQHA